MRVALIAEVFLPKVDGVVHRTVNLIRQLQAGGDEVLVFCPRGAQPGPGDLRTVEFRSFPCPGYPEYRVGLPDARLERELSAFGPDVVHFVNPFAFGFRCFDRLQGRWSGPCVFSFHTLYGEFVKSYGALRPLSRLIWWLAREYHNSADMNLTVSAAMVGELRQRGFERVELWPPAVDADLFHPAKADEGMRRRLLGGGGQGTLLLTASRLAPEKNVEFLADVLPGIHQARLAIVGDGPHRAALERRFRGLPVHFTGYLKGPELAAAFASADAFVYASETETMGNVVLEAMASGLAVVAPRAGGLTSLVQHGETGLLYPARDPDRAAGEIRRLMADDEWRRRLGAHARARAAVMTWAVAAQQIREYYQALATRPGQCPGVRLRTSSARALAWSLSLARWTTGPCLSSRVHA